MLYTKKRAGGGGATHRIPHLPAPSPAFGTVQYDIGFLSYAAQMYAIRSQMYAVHLSSTLGMSLLRERSGVFAQWRNSLVRCTFLFYTRDKLPLSDRSSLLRWRISLLRSTFLCYADFSPRLAKFIFSALGFILVGYIEIPSTEDSSGSKGGGVFFTPPPLKNS